MTRPHYTLDELLAECDPSAELTVREREWLDAPAVGREILPPYDPARIENTREVAAHARAKHGIR